MRKVIVSMFVTIDGFIAGPNGEMDWVKPDEEFEKYSNDQLGTMDTLLLGRVTFQMFANYWPSQTSESADILNNLPKVVFSKTLEKVEWKNARLVKENIAEEIQKLKQQPGKGMVIYGGSGIVSTFMQLGLIDEYRLWVHPVVLGSGKPLFKNINDRHNLKLIKSETLKKGVVVLHYQPIQK
jgi:dihydrofolate reductase